jgi:dienelactone hydrolase
VDESNQSSIVNPELPTADRKRRRRRIWLWVLLIPLIALAIGALGFTIWAYTPPDPMPEALAALQSDELVQVSEDPWLTFTPVGEPPTCGFIFYPGGRVDPRSYAPAARAIAEAGFTTVITPMPFNLAVFAPDRADDVQAAHPEVGKWAIGGHSLGGAMAANYVFGRPDSAVQTIIFWAAYPADNNSLADRENLSATSISGTLDGLATPADIEASKALLPADARFVAIEGGNHAQFGWYGDQSGDLPATISREEQQAKTITATLETLDAMCETIDN